MKHSKKRWKMFPKLVTNFLSAKMPRMTKMKNRTIMAQLMMELKLRKSHKARALFKRISRTLRKHRGKAFMTSWIKSHTCPISHELPPRTECNLVTALILSTQLILSCSPETRWPALKKNILNHITEDSNLRNFCYINLNDCQLI